MVRSASGNSEIHYRYVGADGSLGTQQLLTSSNLENYAPDLAVRGSVFRVVFRSEFTGLSFAYFVDLGFDGSNITSEQSISGSVRAMGRQVSSNDIAFQFADDEIKCSP